MTVIEFKKKYDDYIVDTEEEALEECKKIKITNDHYWKDITVHPIQLNGKWCLMLSYRVRVVDVSQYI